MNAPKSRFDVVGQLAALRRYARSLTRDDGDAEDLVHDALVRAYERRGGFQPGRSLQAWLLAILHNVFVDGTRSRRAEGLRVQRAGELAAPYVEPAQDHHVRLGQVRRAFMDLPEEQRACLHLIVIEGLSYAEAAAALDIPVGTLMSRLARARATLRAIEDDPAASTDGASAAAPPRGRHLRVVGGSDEPAR